MCPVLILDHELILFVGSLPIEYNKLRFRQGKIVHKEFAKKMLPEKIVNRAKKSFLSPTKEWVKRKDVLG